MSSYLDIDENSDSGLVDILSSLTGIKFNGQASQEYADDVFEADTKGKSHCSDSLMMNCDPMLNTGSAGYLEVDVRAWRHKSVDRWTTEDVLFWVSDESEKAGLFVLDADMPNLCRLSGANLIRMTMEDFIKKMSNEAFAKQLYDSLQNNVLNPNNRNNIDSDVLTTLRTCSLEDSVANCPDEHSLSFSYNYSGCDAMSGLSISSYDSMEVGSDHDSGVDSCSDSDGPPNLDDSDDVVHLLNNNINVIMSSLAMSHRSYSKHSAEASDSHFNSWSSQWSNNSDDQIVPLSEHCNDNSLPLLIKNDLTHKEEEQPIKKRPGRPRGIRKPKPEKIGRIWEFLRDLLHNPKYNPSVICWEDYDLGTFKFVDSNKVAQLWGSKRDNSIMTFDKFSRAMRYYYKGKILIPVQKRLVYQFGTNATGWRITNPILR